ncbi:Disease resistance protein RPS2 [Camellia lanceoleosa]|uniref:Disease resistance protein RPS2 n=1 Tax=Camellia lanceoleosa TaxID=1840588 RepID=A0ACC0FSJ5_9ERIC|nr:Disease resistance protein RPS2 [Camellia lanceoleosa]
MEEVIWKEKGEDDATNKMEFPALESMTLCFLPMLIGFCRGTDEIEFPQLKALVLRELPQLKWLFLNSSNPFSESMENHNATFLSLFPHKVALPSLEELELMFLDNLEGLGHIPISVGSFSKLRKVRVEYCGKLLYVFPSQFLTRLRNLEDLTVENCSLLEKVFELEMVDCKEQESKMLSLLKSLKLKHLPQLDYISKRDPIGFMYISQLSILHVHGCDNLRYQFPHSMMKYMLQLQELDIRRCKMMSRIIVDEKGQGKSLVDKIEFTQLKILRLYDLPNLVSFFPKVIATSTTSTECHQNVMQTLFNEKLRFLFSLSMAQCILQLRELEIKGCKMMSTIVREEDSHGEILVDNIEFTQLKILRLYDMQNLVSIFSKVTTTMATSFEHIQNPRQSLFDEKVAFPSLEELELHGFQNMNEIWCNQLQIGSFNKLINLYVSNCGSLRNMFSLFMARHLVHLERLVINKCSIMEEVVAEEDEDEEEEEEGRINRTPLPKLEYLKLIDLPELKSFFHVTHDWELPLITDVTVFNCPKMKTFSHGVICTPKLQRVFVKQGKYTWSPGREGEDWLWISDLNQTILHLIEKQQQEEQVQQHLQQQEDKI